MLVRVLPEGVIVLKKPKFELKGPSRIAMILMTCGIAATAMLAWVLWDLGVLVDTFVASTPFVAAWAIVIVLSVAMLVLFRKATLSTGVSSTVFILLGVTDFVLVAAAVALSVWSLLPALPGGSLFGGGQYGLQVMACALLIVAGAACDPLLAKYRKRPLKVRATPMSTSQSTAAYDGTSGYGTAPRAADEQLAKDLGLADDDFWSTSPSQ